MTDAVVAESDRITMHGVSAVEKENTGKTVDTAWLKLEARHGPTPPRRVVSIRTQDGAVYRFQRYGRDEFLAFYNRENPDGSEFGRKAALPEHVEAVRRAIMDGSVLPDFEEQLRAEQRIENPDSVAVEAERTDHAQLRSGVATDGGNSHAGVVEAQLRMADQQGGERE